MSGTLTVARTRVPLLLPSLTGSYMFGLGHLELLVIATILLLLMGVPFAAVIVVIVLV